MIHKTADVEIEMPKSSKVWRWTQILKGSVIGEGCGIGSHCCIEGAVLGDRVRVGNYSDLREGVTIGSDVFIGSRLTTTNVKYPNPLKKARCYEKTVICDKVTIGANVTIVCGVTIGEGAFVGAGSTVTKDVLPHTRVMGNPAK